MAGSLSGHMLESFNANQSMNLVTSGPMSFNSYLHGSQAFTPQTFATQNPFVSEEISEATAKQIAALQSKLNQKLGPEYISQRPGPGGGQKLTYAEGWKIINLANEVFGFNGWSSNLVSLSTDFIDYNEESKRYTVGVTAIVRVTLRHGVYHEDIGYGMLENSKSKGMALDKCKKEAVTDGLKRALRNFGNLLGNCLYDKAYTQEVVKLKVAPPKFDASELHRRPECEVKPSVASSSNASSGPNLKTSTSVSGVDSSIPSYSAPHTSKVPSVAPPSLQKKANPTTSSNTSLNTNKIAAHTTLQQLPCPGPNHNQPIRDSRSTNDIVPQRKVTFSNATTSDVNNFKPHDNVASSSRNPADTTSKSAVPDCAEEDFFGCSEDDAFYASVDLGEYSEFGRPIEDEDMGRPIDYESVGDISTSHSNISTRPMNQVATHKTGNAMGMMLGLLPQQQQKRAQGSNSSMALKADSWQDENVPPSVRSSISSNTRSGTPSVGGFQFPPGMNPFLQQNQSRPPGQQLQSPVLNAGAKRPAEPSTNDRYQSGMKRGMGLQTGREILGQLEIGEGGDIKRIRR